MAQKTDPVTGGQVEVPNIQVRKEMAAHVARGGKIIIQTTRCGIGSTQRMFGIPFRIIRESSAAEYLKENKGHSPVSGLLCYEVEMADK